MSPIFLGDFIANNLIKWLLARPVAAIVGVLALLWLIFNYQNIGTVYLLAKYLVLLGVGIYAYPHIEKLVSKAIGKGDSIGKMIFSLIMVFVLLYILRQVFFIAALALIVLYFVKGD